MSNALRILSLLAATLIYIGVSQFPWHGDTSVRQAAGIVLAVLALWITEAAPLGVIALIIPVAATLTGILTFRQALQSWGDPIVFLFMAAFLLARALEKYGAFDWLLRLRWTSDARSITRITLMVVLISGALSVLQNNTAVAAMLLPAVLAIARKLPTPAIPMLALAYGATFGGMATPVGTAPNLIGYAEMRALDESVNFVSWMKVGVPVWLGTTAIGCTVLLIAKRFCKSVSVAAVAPAPQHSPSAVRSGGERFGCRVAIVAFISVAAVWLTVGTIKSLLAADDPTVVWINKFLPDALPPLVAAWILFLIPLPDGSGPRTVLDRADFSSIDWDTIFLIAGGLCLGEVLESSGAALALAQVVGAAELSPTVMLLAIGGVTVLLSELTSNTATASLMVPIAAKLAEQLGLPPVEAIWLVALCASLGFALPMSTPPNAIVYGTRLIRLRFMICVGVIVDSLCLVWVVLCLRWLG